MFMENESVKNPSPICSWKSNSPFSTKHITVFF